MSHGPMEVIPAIDLKSGRCVRLYQGDYQRETVYSDDPVSVALSWQQQGAPRLHLVDLDGAAQGRLINLDYITEINPLRVGTYLPGAHIPIIDERLMFEDPEPADAGILFAWNYADEVIPKLRERGWHGEIIFP